MGVAVIMLKVSKRDQMTAFICEHCLVFCDRSDHADSRAYDQKASARVGCKASTGLQFAAQQLQRRTRITLPVVVKLSLKAPKQVNIT